MRFFELTEDISMSQLRRIEAFANELWHKIGVDVSFTGHFLNRLNDERNGEPITVEELIRLFKEEYVRYGKNIAELDNTEAVMRDLLTKINLPFVIKDSPQGKELVAKTVIRKDNFKTNSPEFAVKEHNAS